MASPLSRSARPAAGVATSLVALLAATSATALAVATPATVTSSSLKGMVYTGTTASTITRVTLSGTTFTVDDNGPVTAGIGCTAVAGDPTQVRCTAFKEPTTGVLKRFTVKASSGNDTVFNATAVGMIADGGIGNDTMHGSVTGGDALSGGTDTDKLVGNGGNDSLSGGSGTDLLEGGGAQDFLQGGSGDDTMRGGDGDDTFHAGFGELNAGLDGSDTIDGGPGLHDEVDYTNYGEQDTSHVKIDLFTSGVYNDGADGEKDDVQSTVEDVNGSLEVGNTIFGNAGPNRLKGGIKVDLILGLEGADFLVGDSGDDIISSNNIITGLDGAKDTVNGGPDTDTCTAGAADNDSAFGCEK